MAAPAIDKDAPKICPVKPGDPNYLDEASLVYEDILANPEPYYEAMREHDPVHYDKKLQMWLITRYEDLQTVNADPNLYAVGAGYREQYSKGFFEEFKAILEKDGGGFFPDAIMSEPPYHTRIRRLIEGTFTAHKVKELEGRIRKVVVDLIDSFAGNGSCDAVRDFAIPVTIHVICEQLGISLYDAKKISRWSEAVTAQIGRMQNREQMIENARHICELQKYLINEMKDREANPKNDLISGIVHASVTHEDGTVEKLTFEEAVSIVRAVLIAGNDTTATALGNLAYLLATRPDLAEALYENVDDDRFVTRFVEEHLRRMPPIRGLSRLTMEDTVLNGKHLPKGSHLLNVYGSGNHDPQQFPDPLEFKMDRPNLGRHVVFGGGVHRCIGLALARMEVKIVAQELIRRVKDLRLAIDPGDIRYMPTVATQTIANLPVTFSRREG
ncbi:MAG: cytochrome P450 [Sphingomonadales bacterium]|nr:cytochrome P450 [Sphingomonadales bacterium]